MLIANVESTTLATVAYDQGSEVLQLEFCNKAAYLYFDVPAAVHQALLGAPSKGRYFNRTIRGRFRYRRISNFPAARPEAGCVGRCSC